MCSVSVCVCVCVCVGVCMCVLCGVLWCVQAVFDASGVSRLRTELGSEIAKRMECSIGTVMSRLFYARRRMAALLAGLKRDGL